MLLGAPPGTLGLAQPSDNPSLIIFDNHESHLSLEVIKLAKRSGVEILTLPLHSSNKLQPLDVGVFGPFQSYYRTAHDSWMTRHPGKTFSIYNVAECVGIAHVKALTPQNIQAAFKKVGIYPYDKHVFTEVDFLPCKVTDRPDPTQENNITANEPQSSSTSEVDQTQQSSRKTFISPKEFKGFPKVTEVRSNRKPRKKGSKEPIKSSEAAVKSAKRDIFQTTNIKKPAEHLDSNFETTPTNENENSVNLEEYINKKPEKGDYVLVEFVKCVFYIGQILTEANNEKEVEIFFLRKSKKSNGFVAPQAVDICLISIHQIVLVLPRPVPTCIRVARIFDEMALQPHIDYDVHSDRMLDFQIPK
ncbi:hypothetical protein NQ315_014935 [Exocentrus adspersus]|uniref:DDE-1 domain-containing protein n=1 Tax=Exocentrus adspersus TaxID=1586481 RepID=A0AAV8VAS3_9CUCU|nr:hypothetical protein NQ315_014935 [Exocentrus adspersus]